MNELLDLGIDFSLSDIFRLIGITMPSAFPQLMRIFYEFQESGGGQKY